VAASFQEALVDTLVAKLKRAVKRTGLKKVAVGGGVACNARLREKLDAAGAKSGFRAYFPPRELCTDNAAMVAALAYCNLASGREVAEIDASAT
jgi:N6-L-threonylcarbamoyladenine synthase